jgi:hypothetical protein
LFRLADLTLPLVPNMISPEIWPPFSATGRAELEWLAVWEAEFDVPDAPVLPYALAEPGRAGVEVTFSGLPKTVLPCDSLQKSGWHV